MIGAGLWTVLMSMTFIPQIVPNGWASNSFLFLVWPAFLYMVIWWNRFAVNPMVLVPAAVVTWGIAMAMNTNTTIRTAWSDPKNPKNRASAIGSYFGLSIIFGVVMLLASLFQVNMYDYKNDAAKSVTSGLNMLSTADL